MNQQYQKQKKKWIKMGRTQRGRKFLEFVEWYKKELYPKVLIMNVMMESLKEKELAGVEE